MNWKQYFDLRDNLKQNFRKYLIIVIVINLFLLRKVIIAGPVLYFSEKNISCPNIVLNETMDWDNVTMNQTGVPSSGWWTDCEPEKELSMKQNLALWRYRLFYTPLFILSDIIAAAILALVLYFYGIYKLSRKKPKKDDSEATKEDKKEEKK